MASDAIAFLEAMELDQVDVLGFSIGSFVAQEIALITRRWSAVWSSRPQRPGARLKIYPDSAHGFLFQHHAEFAADVGALLSAAQ